MSIYFRLNLETIERQHNLGSLYEALERALLAEIDLNADNLRFYRLTEPLAQHVKEFGVFRATDFEKDSLIV
jgi:CRISPR-associated protein Cas2